jgi:hypothetical protein
MGLLVHATHTKIWGGEDLGKEILGLTETTVRGENAGTELESDGQGWCRNCF